MSGGNEIIRMVHPSEMRARVIRQLSIDPRLVVAVVAATLLLAFAFSAT